MPVARLFVLAVLLCSPLAFGQNAQKPPHNDISEPWSIVRAPQDSAQDLAVRANQYKADYFQIDACGQFLNPDTYWPGGRLSKEQLADNSCYNSPSFPTKPDRLLAEAEVESDTTCYSIRTYRVARDSPDSDSTHPVGTSTCQRATRYQLKSADIQQETAGR
jgi:hypothetical protein